MTIPSLPMDAPLNRWLESLSKLAGTLGVSDAPRSEAVLRIVEANVKQQVENLCKSQTIVNAWTKGTPKGQKVLVHGWVYEIGTGRLKDLGLTRGADKSV
jgi:carbonic anhydrase